MKKILLGLVMLATAATMNAQIELEHVFEGAPVIDNLLCYRVGVDDLYIISKSSSSSSNADIYLYNVDFSLYGVYKAHVGIIARNVFTTDNKICFIRKENYGHKTVIFDENNKVIKEILLDENLEEIEYYLAQIGNQYKLMIEGWMPPTNDGDDYKKYTYIYSCPGDGETTTSVENVPAKVKRNAYPNPASDLVTLPYDANGATSMKIYDMQGKLVERKFLDKNKQELQLNVKNYTSGMYFFEVNGESNSFIVE